MTKENPLDDALSSHNKTDITLSYSRVSDFDRNGPKALIKPYREETEALKMGSLVDNLLFNKNKFNEIYHVSNFNEPTSSLSVLCKIILQNFATLPSLEVVTNLVNINDLWSNIKKPELKIAKYNNEVFWGYLKDKFESVNKIVVTPEELQKAQETVNTLMSHKFSKHLFDPKFEHIYQQEFKIKINQFYFRGIIDIVTIDHKNKLVYFKDLKTTSGNTSEFLISFIKYRYYLQEAVYSLAFEKVCEDLKLKNYKLAPFEFVYISFKEQLPLIYEVTPKWHKSALKGFKTNNNYKYKGLYELIDEIYFHWKNQIYDLPMNIYENNGRVILTDDFIEYE